MGSHDPLEQSFAPARAPLPERRILLLGFLMCRVLSAAAAELLELETAGGRLLVLRRRVVPLLAIRALQCHDFAHLPILPHRSQPAWPQFRACRRLLPLSFVIQIRVRTTSIFR